VDLRLPGTDEVKDNEVYHVLKAFFVYFFTFILIECKRQSIYGCLST
jgi:hypothetical protein